MVYSWLVSLGAGTVARRALAGSSFVNDNLFARYFPGFRMTKAAPHFAMRALKLVG